MHRSSTLQIWSGRRSQQDRSGTDHCVKGRTWQISKEKYIGEKNSRVADVASVMREFLCFYFTSLTVAVLRIIVIPKE